MGTASSIGPAASPPLAPPEDATPARADSPEELGLFIVGQTLSSAHPGAQFGRWAFLQSPRHVARGHALPPPNLGL